MRTGRTHGRWAQGSRCSRAGRFDAGDAFEQHAARANTARVAFKQAVEAFGDSGETDALAGPMRELAVHPAVHLIFRVLPDRSQPDRQCNLRRKLIAYKYVPQGSGASSQPRDRLDHGANRHLEVTFERPISCLLYTSPSPRD